MFRFGPAFHIGLRFTISRKRSLILSLLGVMFGVGFYICTQAQTQGFQEYFIESVLGTAGAVELTERFQVRYTTFSGMDGAMAGNQQQRKYYDGITDANMIMKVSKEFSDVLACAPIVRGSVTIHNGYQSDMLTIQGIDLNAHLRTTTLKEQIIKGSLDTYRYNPNCIMLGSLFATKLQIKVGDTVTLQGIDPKKKTFTVAAIFRSGNNIIDERYGYVSIRTAQELLKRPFLISRIIYKIRDPERAPALATHFERLFGHRSRSWQERERNNLQIFSTLRLSAAITVSLIILVSGALIFNTLTMSVLDKIREIAILRSMGYRKIDITFIFLFQGLLIAVFGSACGVVFGAMLTYIVSLIPVKIKGFFYANHFMVTWSIWHYVQAVGIAFVVVLIASYFPARRAANLPPVATLRGSGQ